MQAYEIVSGDGIDALQRTDRTAPKPGHGEVLVRMRASALNYRDLMTVKDPISRKLPLPRIPNSDGAGEVLAVGAGVTRFSPGDRVASCFFQRWDDGDITADEAYLHWFKPKRFDLALGGRFGLLRLTPRERPDRPWQLDIEADNVKARQRQLDIEAANVSARQRLLDIEATNAATKAKEVALAIMSVDLSKMSDKTRAWFEARQKEMVDTDGLN